MRRNRPLVAGTLERPQSAGHDLVAADEDVDVAEVALVGVVPVEVGDGRSP